MQHLWLTERIVDIVAAELGLDPVEVRKRNYVKAEEMPYETPNGCVYDSGDYARCLDIALDLVGYDSIEERRADAAPRGKLLGVGIGSTLDSGTNNFGQSQLLNPELQFSGNNEAASVKLDIFGEVVVTLGTVPQGQGHETTAAQVVADIIGCSPDQVNVRRGHDSWFNSHAGFSGTYASQFAVTGLGAVKGAAELLRDEMVKLAGVRAPGPGGGDRARRRVRAREGRPSRGGAAVHGARRDRQREQRVPAARLQPDAQPPLRLPAVLRRRRHGGEEGQADADLRDADPRLCGRGRPGDGRDRDRRLRGRGRLRDRIHPQIVEGQVHGATVHAIGAALHENFVYDEDGTLLTANFYDYHVPHALDLPPLKTGAIESPSPFTPLGAKGMGEGGGGGIHCVCAAIQDALRSGGHDVFVFDSCNPAQRVWEMLNGASAAGGAVKLDGTKELDAPREVVWSVINDPAEMAQLMPGVESFEIVDDRHWKAKVKVLLGLGGLRMSIEFEKLEERPLEFASMKAKGTGRRRADEHDDVVRAERVERRHGDEVGGGCAAYGAGRFDGAAGVAADREPAWVRTSGALDDRFGRPDSIGSC